MKVKKIKKLALKKISIANLDNDTVDFIKDGYQMIKGGEDHSEDDGCSNPYGGCLTKFLPICHDKPSNPPPCTGF